MLPSQSGNDSNHHSFVFPVEDQSHIGEVRRFAMILCARMEFDETRQGRVGIVVNELGTNLIKYSSQGRLVIRAFVHNKMQGVEIVSIDSGPGIQNTLAVLDDGYSTGTSPGNGLGAVKRLSDDFDIYSNVGKGSVILSVIYSTNDQTPSRFDFAVMSVPIKGEMVSGDDWYVDENEGRLGIMMVDGLGHGPVAHKAAIEAVDEFKKNVHVGVGQILTAVHSRLRSTRGGAVFLIQTDASLNIEYTSAGNIRAVVQSVDSSKTLISQNGTAGLRIPTLKVYKHEMINNSCLILHSDGINSRWNLENYPGVLTHHPAILAALLYRDFNRGNDDATILIVKERK